MQDELIIKRRFSINALIPGGSKKVTNTYTAAFSLRFNHICVTFLLPPDIKGLKYVPEMWIKRIWAFHALLVEVKT